MRSNLSILNQLFFFIFVILCVSTVNSEDCEQELTDALFKTWVTIEVKSYNGGQIGIGMKFESKGTTYQEMTTQFSGNLEFPVYFFGIIWNSDIFIALYFYKTPKPALLLVHPRENESPYQELISTNGMNLPYQDHIILDMDDSSVNLRKFAEGNISIEEAYSALPSWQDYDRKCKRDWAMEPPFQSTKICSFVSDSATLESKDHFVAMEKEGVSVIFPNENSNFAKAKIQWKRNDGEVHTFKLNNFITTDSARIKFPLLDDVGEFKTFAEQCKKTGGWDLTTTVIIGVVVAFVILLISIVVLIVLLMVRKKKVVEVFRTKRARPERTEGTTTAMNPELSQVKGSQITTLIHDNTNIGTKSKTNKTKTKSKSKSKSGPFTGNGRHYLKNAEVVKETQMDETEDAPKKSKDKDKKTKTKTKSKSGDDKKNKTKTKTKTKTKSITQHSTKQKKSSSKVTYIK